jgi:chemotaxis protein methyltransferase CheR
MPPRGQAWNSRSWEPISTRVLRQAQAGIYQGSQILPVPLGLRRKYLMRSRNKAQELVRMTPELRGRVSFHRLNFMNEEYGIKDRFDAIFFRNVMIYFDKNTQEAVTNRLCRHLAAGGYLFAGHAESLVGLNVPLEPVATSVYRRRSAYSAA